MSRKDLAVTVVYAGNKAGAAITGGQGGAAFGIQSGDVYAGKDGNDFKLDHPERVVCRWTVNSKRPDILAIVQPQQGRADHNGVAGATRSMGTGYGGSRGALINERGSVAGDENARLGA